MRTSLSCLSLHSLIKSGIQPDAPASATMTAIVPPAGEPICGGRLTQPDKHVRLISGAIPPDFAPGPDHEIVEAMGVGCGGPQSPISNAFGFEVDLILER